MAFIVEAFDSTLGWQVLCGVLAFCLMLNLLMSHQSRRQQWRQRRVKKAMQHNGITDYQERVKALAKNDAELIRAPHDISGINVEIGLHNGGRNGQAEEESLGDISFEQMLDNVEPLKIHRGRHSTVKNNDIGDSTLEDYIMGKPTQNELDKAMQTAAAMRESGADDKYMAKCLLNLSYRNTLLERVLQHAELYVHAGNDPHEHKLLLKAIKDVQEAGQTVRHERDGLGSTFMIS